MKILTIAELLCLTRFELEEMERHLGRQARELRAGSDELRDTLKTLENIRMVLARPGVGRGRRGGGTPAPAP